MPDAISFAWLTSAFLAGQKTVTRRDWHGAYARRFTEGKVVDALNRTRRANGDVIGQLRLTADVREEPNSAMPGRDYWGEGFAYLYGHPAEVPKRIFGEPATRDSFSPAAFKRWQNDGDTSYVIRFEIVEISLPLSAARLFATEIDMVARYWRQRLDESLRLPAEPKMQALGFFVEALRAELTAELQFPWTTGHLLAQRAGLSPLLTTTAAPGEAVDRALSRAKIRDVDVDFGQYSTKLFPGAVTAQWPGPKEWPYGNVTAGVFNCRPENVPNLDPDMAYLRDLDAERAAANA